jgi:plastocyanin
MNIRHQTAINLTAAVLLVSLCGCGPAHTLTITLEEETQTARPPANSAHRVVIENGMFEPEEITVGVGDTITWTNQDSENRTITSWREDQEADGWRYANIGAAWDSGDIRPGQSYSRTFNEAGTFEYLSFPMYLYGDFQQQPRGVITVE